MNQDAYDLVVIGGGPAGTGGALAAAACGKRVALVERESHVGGAGLNTGTIPSKALRESALLISGWRRASCSAWTCRCGASRTVADLTLHEIHVRDAIRGQRKRACASDVWICSIRASRIPRFAHHPCPATDRPRDLARRAQNPGGHGLLAHASAEFPFEHPRVHDSNEILEIRQLPRKLAVVGARRDRIEYACTFAALGVEVHLVDGRDMLLPFLDHEVSAAITGDGGRGRSVSLEGARRRRAARRSRAISC